MWRPTNCKKSSDSESDAENSNVDSESILKEIQQLYTERAVGLRDTAKALHSEKNLKITVPRQKITVLIVGHHNIAKQKFLDLYFDDTRQGSFIAKVDYEKLDRFFITQGDRRKWLSGETVLDYCPHLEQLRNVPGLKDYLTTEIAARQRKSLVSFILAPENRPEEQLSSSALSPAISNGEDDEDNHDLNNNPSVSPSNSQSEPFKIEQAIGTLGSAADLIFIFFDPSGSISPAVTLKPFAKLWTENHEKLHLLLAKADPDESSEEVREDVLTEIVREVWKIKEVRKVGYLPKIYCPDLTTRSKDDERLWNVIQTATTNSVERALKQLEKDSIKLRLLLDARKRRNNRAKDVGISPWSCYIWFILFFFVMGGFAISQINDLWCNLQGGNFKAVCNEMMRSETFVSIIVLLGILYIIASLYWETGLTQISPEEEELLEKRINFINYAIEQKKQIELKSKRISKTTSDWSPSIFSSKNSI